MNVESLTLTSIGPIINHTIPFYGIKICPKINVQWPTCCLERQKRTTPRPSWPAPFSASTRKKSMRVKSLVCTTRWAMRWNQESWNNWTESAEVFGNVFFEVTDVWHHRWCLMFVQVALENQWVWKSMRENITILSNGLLGILQASLQDVLYRQNNQKDPKRMTKNISARLANISFLNSHNDQ